ncbi:hypothetical protein OEA41_004172 [Lepraria neglecta]|uniref:Uncharacterized protein n=1 Tax=Lepraria neglecta TaxID=209136 RepID=A0AAD9Z960_9LECA|nr:hypothetical protein OEA41_004172 [Lepraria neglecta]
MAPLLGSPMTPSPTSAKSNPRRILPIVPAVPRSLDRKPKPKVQTPIHSPAQEATLLPIQETKEQLPAESASVTPAQTPQNGEPVDVDAKAGVSEHRESSIGNWAEEVEEAEQDEPKDVTPSSVQLPYHGYGSAHNISFYPPPPPSSNDASSPAHSIYQGYTYGSTINGCPLQVKGTPRASISSRSEMEDRAPSFQHDYKGSRYYSHHSTFPPLGSQPPLTPSATPFSNMPQQSNYVNGHLPPETSAYNCVPLLQRPSGYPAHSTMNPGIFRPNFEQAENGLETSQDETHKSKLGRTTTLDSMHDIPVNGPFSRVPVVAYLQQSFDLPEYADCRLVLTHKNERFNKKGWFLSSLLLAQSPKLREMLKTSQLGADSRRLIELTLTDRFITPNSMESALRVCYGESPLTFTGVNPQDQYTMSKAQFLVPWMTEALPYAATGCLLQLDGVVLRGLDVASKILDWENLEAALSFGLESDFERGRSASADVVPAYRSLHEFHGDPSTSYASSAPRSKEYLASEAPDHPTGSTTSSEDFQQPPPQSAFDVLMHCLRFITDNFPMMWQLDVSARPLADVDRLPATPESRSPLSKSRLSRIQFGEHPSEATAKSTNRNVLISTILLSLPFIWLDYLLKSVEEPIRQNITSIVKERERRRQIVLQSESVPHEQREAAKDYEWAEAGYEESVVMSEDGEMTLSRKYTGVARHTPDDSTADPKV